MPKKGKSEKTNPALGKAKIILSGVKKPKEWRDLPRLLFDNHPIRQNIAQVLLEKMKEAKREHEHITSSDWLPIILEAMKRDPMYSELGKYLEKEWMKMERKSIDRVSIQEKLTEKAKEKAKELGIQGSNPFTKYRAAWYHVTKYMEKAGMIKREGGIIEPSLKFSEKLEEISNIWKEFIEEGGEEEEW